MKLVPPNIIRLLRSRFLAPCLFLGLAHATFAQNTSLTMQSEPGDYIGGGQNYSYTLADGEFSAYQNFGGGVSISFNTPSFDHFWYLDFSAPANAPLRVGVYTGATRFPFQAPTEPGLSVSGDGRGCNELTGSFEVKKIIYGADGAIIAFWATFTQHCEGAPPALTGEIKFNADATGGAVNQAPGVYAGPDQRIFELDSAMLSGIAGDDDLPNGNLTLTWSVLDGPGSVTFGDPNSAKTTVSFGAFGSYTLLLTADDGELSASDEIVINVVDTSAETSLVMSSDPGDYIGQGQNYSYTLVDGDFTAVRNFGGGVSIGFGTPNFEHSWSLDFSAPANAPLTVGTYTGVARFPFQSPVQPGLDVSGDGRGCNTLTGSFVVNKIIYGANDSIIAFWATFVQHCEGEKPALTGEIKFNAGAVGDAVNQPPGVYAGEDQRFFAPNAATLSGIAGDDGLPNGSLNTTWSVVEGPGTVTFANPNALQTTATFSVFGRYTLRLTADDGEFAVGDDVIISVLNPNAETSLTMSSEPGDYIGGGQNYSYTLADGDFHASRNFDGGVSLSFNTPNFEHFWHLDFAAPANAPLTPGRYDGVMRFPFQAPNQPGLSVDGDGRGCNELTGSFHVKKIIYGANDSIIAFSATFVQHCEGMPPALTGEIKFNAEARGPGENQLPGVYAGPDQRIPFPNTAILAGIAGDDHMPRRKVITMWSVADGPGTVVFAQANNRRTTATFSEAGQYTLRLTAFDGKLSNSDDVIVTVVDPKSNTSLTMVSEPGDYIGQGQTYSFTPIDGDFSTQVGFSNSISINFDTPTHEHSWSLSFAAPNGVPLTVGIYEGAMRFPFQGPDEPGLDVSGEGRGCNTLTGRFEVNEIVYGANKNIERFRATFEQHCEGMPPALTGEIRINATPTPPSIDSLIGRLSGSIPGLSLPSNKKPELLQKLAQAKAALSAFKADVAGGKLSDARFQRDAAVKRMMGFITKVNELQSKNAIQSAIGNELRTQSQTIIDRIKNLAKS